jgi:hypothetical protein
MNTKWVAFCLILLVAVNVSAATNFKKPPVKVVWNTSGDSNVNCAINNLTNNDGGGCYWYEVFSPESDDSGYEWGIRVDLGGVYNITQVRVNQIAGEDDSACSVKLVKIGILQLVWERKMLWLLHGQMDGWMEVGSSASLL